MRERLFHRHALPAALGCAPGPARAPCGPPAARRATRRRASQSLLLTALHLRPLPTFGDSRWRSSGRRFCPAGCANSAAPVVLPGGERRGDALLGHPEAPPLPPAGHVEQLRDKYFCRSTALAENKRTYSAVCCLKTLLANTAANQSRCTILPKASNSVIGDLLANTRSKSA